MTTDGLNEIEKATLAGLIRWPDAVADAMQLLDAADFRTDPHQRIYRALVAVWDAGTYLDIGTLADELHRRGEIADIGGYPALELLLEAAATGFGVHEHARTVRDRGLKRRLASVAHEIGTSAEQGGGAATDLIADAERAIFSLAEEGIVGSMVRLRDSIKATIERIDERTQTGAVVGGLSTGFADLDAITSGLHDTELTVAAARPGVGKTSLALQVALQAALEIGPVLFVSLEMSDKELTERLLCSEARVDSQRVRKGTLSKDDADRLIEAERRVGEAPLFIDPTASQKLLRITASARRLKRREGLRLIVIDYLQLIEPENRRDPRHEQVGQISRRLKGLAKELNVPVLALAQLNRAAEESARPRLSHLRESGAIEADADAVWLLHKSDEPGSENVLEVEIAKQRNGPVGTVKLVFKPQFTRFENHALPEVYA